jgi:hypothetical protein
MLPNLVVIGAMKAGTTSLHHYLSGHPDVAMSSDKEPRFFTTEGNWDRGRGWYESQFQTGKPVRGESTPDYTKFPRHAGVPARMHALIPDAKLVYLVRDPVQRLVSHYIDAYSFGRLNASLDEVLESPEGRHLVSCSKYFMQVSQYLPYYDENMILVVTTEDLQADPRSTLAAIFRFLDVDDSFDSPEFGRVVRPSQELRRKTTAGYAALRVVERVRKSPVRKYLPRTLRRPVDALNAWTSRPIERPTFDCSRHADLVAELRDDANSFRELTGKELPAWSV